MWRAIRSFVILAKLRDIFKYTEDDRVEETADERGQSEHLSQNDGPKKEHDGIEAKDKSGNRNIKIMFKRDSKTCRSPGDQIVWKNKDGNSKGIDALPAKIVRMFQAFLDTLSFIHTSPFYVQIGTSIQDDRKGNKRFHKNGEILSA